MGNAPFKMKGSPMQRNFGIGEKETPAPTKDKDWGEYATRAEEEGAKPETVEKLKSKARTQKSAQEYQESDEKKEGTEEGRATVKRFASGEQTHK